MFINQNSNKFKIIQFKDVVSLLLIVIILSATLTASFASSYFSKTSNNNINTKTNINARKLAMFSALAYVDLEKIDSKKFAPDSDSKMKSLTFKEQTMVTDDQLKKVNVDTSLFTMDLSTNKKKDAYNFFFNNLGSTSEIKDWKIVNYTKIKVNAKFFTKTITEYNFAAVTFKKGDDIVVAFRGPSSSSATKVAYCFNILYNSFNELAKIYIKEVAKKYDGNFHLTGWSFGGYIAQYVGGYSLSDRPIFKGKMLTPSSPLVWEKKDSLKEVVTFNTPGFGFTLNLQQIKNQLKNSISSDIADQLLEKFNLDIKIPQIKKIYNDIVDSFIDDKIEEHPIFNKIDLIDFNYNIEHLIEEDSYFDKLKAFQKSNLVKVVNFSTKGDILSQLGTHINKTESFAYTLCRNEISQNNISKPITLSDTISYKVLKIYQKTFKISLDIDYLDIIKSASKEKLDIKSDMSFYNIETLEQFIALTHRLDSFLGNLPYEDNTILPDITNISFHSLYKKLDKNKTYTIYLNIETQNCELESPKLTASNFKTGNLKITNVSLINNKPTKKTVSGVTYNTYTFKINIKTGDSNIFAIVLKGGIGIKEITALNKDYKDNVAYKHVLNNLKTYPIYSII